MLFPPTPLSSISEALILLSFFITGSAGSPSSSSDLCPSLCPDAEAQRGEWSAYHDMNQLSMCDTPLLLDFNVHNALDSRDTHTTIRACSTYTPSNNFARDATANGNTTYSNSTACGIPLSQNTTSQFSIIQSGSPNSTNSATDLEALRITQYRLARQNTTSCKSTTSFIMVGNSVVGVYTGASVPATQFSDLVLDCLIANLTAQGVADNVYVESCSTDPSLSSQNMGIVIGSFSAIPLVQSAVSAWSHGGCMITNSTANSTANSWRSFDLPLLSQPPTATNASTNSSATYSFTPRGGRRLARRDDCTTVQVKSGDSCASLATECGISGADFTKYNSDPSLCSTLGPGQHVCCSAGSLPDFSPKPQADGTCATHSVVTDDTCTSIASANSITVDDISNWNNNTWQFMGCKNIQIGQVICISTGDPPMPASVANAVCGPQVNGTQKPDNMTLPGALASLNPCPLKVCCDIWGQCGNTNEFCTISKSESGAPGTAAPGENGCISNCGTDIISGDPNNDLQIFAVGYFEGFNQQRPCLNMDASEIDVDSYTHLHFGFATISESFDVVIDDNSTDEWDQFRALSGPKIILSFGGWAFSTDVGSYSIFRTAVTEQNRQTFAQNIASFVSSSGIDGVDFDWEYPGAPDIPGIPAASPEDGQNYLAFLKVLRSVLPDDKSISIAAPASYWYLKGYPIAEMSDVVSYIIFMTYDLHGQWDYGNKNSDDGCPAGNCLRSQVNSTETHTSLSMITKAGVPSGKIVIGVTSYGRSFQMTQSGCTGPMCTYTGPNSGATPGRCTQTAGYLAQAEIDEILQNDKSATTFYDKSSESDIMDTQWVAYMSGNTRAARTQTYHEWNFLGTVDWAIDLAAFSKSELDEFEPLPNCTNAGNYHTIDDVLNDHSIPDDCVNMYIMNAMSETMAASLVSYQDIMSDGYKGKYNAYAREVRGQGYWAWNDVWAQDQNKYWDCIETKSGKNKTVSCSGTPGGSAYYYVLKDQDAFCNDMESLYNIDCDWVTQQVTTYTDGSGGIACERFGDCPDDGTLYWPDLDSNFPVLDPSALITQSLDNYTGFSDWLGESAGAAQAYMFPEMDSDAVDGSSTMVFSLQASVQAMQQVADVGEQAEQEQKKEMILAFITAFLLMVPGIGEAADGVAALAQVARIAKLVDVAGNSALSIYGAVEDPKSAPMAVAGILLGGLALRDESAWGKAASETRSMSQDVIKSMGDGVAEGMSKVKQTCKECSP